MNEINDEDDDDDDDDSDETTTRQQTKASSQPQISTPTMITATSKQYFGGGDLDKNRAKFANKSLDKLLKPSLMTSIVYHQDDVTRVFYLVLFLLLAGEFFSAPAITLADSCTLQYLGPTRVDLYGRQRMFGSLGWALAMFCVGLLLDRSKAFTDHPCGEAGPDERNYTVCFAIYSVLMGCALMIASQFQFQYGVGEQIPLKSFTQAVKSTVQQARDPRTQQFDSHQLANESDDSMEREDSYTAIDAEKPPARPPAPKSAFVEISEAEKKEKYLKLLNLCKTLKHGSFLFVVWFMGIGVGLVFTFLFWHLQDLGGSPALYGELMSGVYENLCFFFEFF